MKVPETVAFLVTTIVPVAVMSPPAPPTEFVICNVPSMSNTTVLGGGEPPPPPACTGLFEFIETKTIPANRQRPRLFMAECPTK